MVDKWVKCYWQWLMVLVVVHVNDRKWLINRLNGTGNYQLIVISFVHLVNNRFDPQHFLVIGENKQQEQGILPFIYLGVDQCHIYRDQKVGTAYPNCWTIVCSFVGRQMLRKVLDLKTCEHEPILVYAFGQSKMVMVYH